MGTVDACVVGGIMEYAFHATVIFIRARYSVHMSAFDKINGFHFQLVHIVYCECDIIAEQKMLQIRSKYNEK